MSEASVESLDPSTSELLRHVSTATLTTQLLKRGYHNSFIPNLIAMRPDLRLVGTAVTLRYVPSRRGIDPDVEYDNTRNVQRLAVESIEPHQVLVIDARQNVDAASFGHIIATRMLRRGAAGLVTDGALRDTSGFRTLGLPTYCRGAHATTSSAVHHPIDMNRPISCGGVLVAPGDVVVGDADGVVVFPVELAEDLSRSASEQEHLEEFIWRKVDTGSAINGVYPADQDTVNEFHAWSHQDAHGGR